MIRIGGHKLALENQIGLGSLAEIYAARDSATGDVFAVKMLRERWSDNPGKAGRFLSEGATGAAFHHQNIVRYHYAPKAGEPMAILMELIDG